MISLLILAGSVYYLAVTEISLRYNLSAFKIDAGSRYEYVPKLPCLAVMRQNRQKTRKCSDKEIFKHSLCKDFKTRLLLWIRDGRDYGVIKFRAVDNFSNSGVLVVTNCLSLSVLSFERTNFGGGGVMVSQQPYLLITILKFVHFQKTAGRS